MLTLYIATTAVTALLALYLLACFSLHRVAAENRELRAKGKAVPKWN